MRSLLCILPLFILLLSLPLQATENSEIIGTGLIVLDLSESDAARETLYNGFHVLEDLGPILVARPSDSDYSLLHKLNIASKALSLPEGPGNLYCVSLRGLPVEELSRITAVLYQCQDIALVAGDKSLESRLAHPVPHYGLEKGYRQLKLTRIQPVNAFAAPRDLTSGKRVVDPKIQAMVNQVSATNLQNVVQDMENMGERKANSGGFTAETYLVGAFNAIGGLTVSTHQFSASYSDNVIAELPGQVDPSVIYVVGGHYDSTSSSAAAPGADDNASGTSGVVEIARILSQYDFKYTLRFAAFSAEELGLVGSNAYCDKLVADGDHVAAMINLDMTAYRNPSDPYDVGFITNYSSSSLINFCSGVFTDYVPALGITQGTLSGGTSDHQSFTQHGFAACFPFEDLNNYSPYIHTSNDVVGVSANDFTLSRMITQGALASLATLASPLDLEIQHTALSDTTQASGAYTVNAEVGSLIGSNVTRATLHYDTGSGLVSKDMAPTAAGGYISSIPARADAGVVQYYIDAEDDQGNTERYPDGLDAENLSFFVGYQNDVFADDFEINDNGWTHGGTGQDDWMRNVCTGNGGYDAGSAWSGTKVWGNDLGISGYNGNYQPNVDNWLQSPAIDCTGKTGLFLRYRRWLTVEEAQYDKARIQVNGNQVFVNPNGSDLVDTAWMLHEVDISAYADNNPSVVIRYTLTTDGGTEMGGWNIDDLHVGTLSDGDTLPLSHSEVYVSAATGGTIDFALDGTPALANRYYAVLMSGSGTSPGLPIPPITLPLNWDAITDLVAFHPNLTGLVNFQGNLDGSGQGSAAIHFPVITDPGLLGLQLSVAWLAAYPIDFASNPVELLIVP